MSDPAALERAARKALAAIEAIMPTSQWRAFPLASGSDDYPGTIGLVSIAKERELRETILALEEALR